MCVCVCAGDVTAKPGHVLFKFKQAEGGNIGGAEGLEECQKLDWISMNSKEADGGKKRERAEGGGTRREGRETISMSEMARKRERVVEREKDI